VKPTRIPTSEVWKGARVVTFGAPEGMEDKVAAVQAVEDRSGSTGVRRASVRLELEPGDLDKLAAGGHVWISFYGGMLPWSVDVAAPGEIGGVRDAAAGE
jgi:hypothetical protein